MFIFLKLAQKVIAPIGVSLLCFLVLFWLSRKKEARFRLISGLGFCFLFFPSLPIIADTLLHRLEDGTPAGPLAEAAESEVLVVLGGTASPQWGENIEPEELAGSRLLTAVRLYRLSKAKKILVSGGISYKTPNGTRRTEADDMKDILVTMGIPEADILREDRSLNTKENAFFSAEVLKKHQASLEIILVSSAYHMPRATRWFENAGMKVHPVGAGRSSRSVAYTVMDFFPSAAALHGSTGALKEYLGRLPLLLH